MVTRPGESAMRIAKFGLMTARHNHAARVECSANEKHEHEKARWRDRVGAGRGAVGGPGDEPGTDERSRGDTSSRRTRHSDCGGGAFRAAPDRLCPLPGTRQ